MFIRNSIRTPDGTVLVSKHRHDYVEHKDKNGKMYMVDGGPDYLRRIVGDYEELSVRWDDPHEKVREVFTWTSFGRDGKSDPVRTTLDMLSTEHINNILCDCNLMDRVEKLFKEELKVRKENHV